MRRHPLLAAALLGITLPSHALTLVETFTSKFCPSCPAAEAYLAKEAGQDPDMLVVLQHVDYWDRGDQKDPLGNPDFTQRQYDYSNLLASRPGAVFTPQPILNGTTIADPPLWLSWSKTYTATRDKPAPATLEIAKTSSGFIVSLPAGVPTQNVDLWLMGVQASPQHPAIWDATGVTLADVTGATIPVNRASVSKGTHLLAVVQERGPGKVLAVGLMKR